MKSVVTFLAVLLLLQLFTSLNTMCSASSIRGSDRENQRRSKEDEAKLRMLTMKESADAKQQDEEDEEEEDDKSEDKEDKVEETEAPTVAPTVNPSAYPSDAPSDTPTAAPIAPTLAPVKAPTEAPVAPPTDAPVDPLVIQSDSNVTEGNVEVEDVEVVHNETLVDVNVTTPGDSAVNDTVVNATDINVTTAPAPTLAPTTAPPTMPPPTLAPAPTEPPTDAPSELMPCYWRFLTGDACTAHTGGDVVNAYHHQYLLSDGECHHNEFLGFYRARCEGKTADGAPARIFLQDVFCTDDTCAACLNTGIIRPDIYKSHTCNRVDITDVSRNAEFDFAFEFVGGCFANEACSRMMVAGHGK